MTVKVVNNSYSSNQQENLPLILTPFKLRSVEFRNRIVVSPMCQYSAIDGFANSWHMVHVGQYALRGAGLIIMEATGVLPNGRITPDCLGLWKNDQIPYLKEIVQYAHSQGAKIGIQLAHAGRKASCYSPFSGNGWDKLASEQDGGWPTNIVGPSAIQGWPTAGTPREASLEDIKDIVAAFGQAARRAQEAGFDVVEIHGAHGYLIHSFLSPLSNHRLDNYGGSFENRSRLLEEVAIEIRKYWPADKPLFVRISCSDWAEGGWDENDSVKLASLLESFGVDLIDCSSAGLVPHQQMHGTVGGPSEKAHDHGPGWNVPFSDKIAKSASNISLGVVGGIKEAKYANTILERKSADLILVGREFLRNPLFVADVAKEFNVDLTFPLQYNRSK
ncbi:hypothetical protein HDV06_003908 [Boothiomyces sp. JEL0866]|nr:hypothetical protein HDV06_003908 [Boothiomyces sp. JEL0866]